MINKFLKVLIFIVPLIVFPPVFSPYEAPKVIIAEAIIALLFITYYIKSISSLLHPNKLFTLSLILLAIIALINLFINNLPYTFFGNPFRLQGTYLFINLLFLSYLSSKITLNISRKFTFIVFIFLAIIPFILGVDENSRIFGTVGEPNSLAAYFLFLWPFIALDNKSKKKKMKIFSLIVTLIIIFFSGSRSALIGLSLQLIFLILFKSLRLKLGASIVACIPILLMTLAFPLLDNSSDFQNRSLIWKTSTQAGLAKPIIGYGFGNQEYALKETSNKLENNLRFVYVDNSHNLILDWFVQGGIISVALLLSIVYSGLKNLIKRNDHLLITSFLGIFTAMMFNPVSISLLIPFWWILGNSNTSQKDKVFRN